VTPITNSILTFVINLELVKLDGKDFRKYRLQDLQKRLPQKLVTHLRKQPEKSNYLIENRYAHEGIIGTICEVYSDTRAGVFDTQLTDHLRLFGVTPGCFLWIDTSWFD
jgi:hypothetical protein